MAIPRYSCDYSDEDYIDIDLFSSPNLLRYSITPQSPTRDFEFQMYPFPLHKTSPADELFFSGKLLPLHLPPPSQKLLNYSLPESPTEASVRKPDSCFFHPLKYKLKQSSLRQKLKASTAYLKSLFNKSGEEFSCTKSPANRTVQPVTSDRFDNLRYMNISKKSPFGEADHIGRFKLSNGLKRIKTGKEMSQGRHSVISSSSSSGSSPSSNSTFSVSSSKELQLVKRSMNTNSNSEIEKSIEGAIAYCNKSYNKQQSIIL
ncbi:hypothetical protein M5689_009937 [Euphorbia peplus]|nr:hypothetical protein M5689_009937 [Euphorbia peplus]